MDTIIVFDFDGVLVDSGDTVREAYRIAGVDTPEDVLTNTTNWRANCTDEQYAIKNAWYSNLILNAKMNVDLIEYIRDTPYDVMILSAAPYNSVVRWADVTGVHTYFVLIVDGYPLNKIDYLRWVPYDRIVIIDDNPLVKPDGFNGELHVIQHVNTQKTLDDIEKALT